MNLEDWWSEIAGGFVLTVLSLVTGRAIKRVDETTAKVEKLERETVSRSELASLVKKLDEREERADEHRAKLYERLDANLKEQQRFNIEVAQHMGATGAAK